MGLEWRIAFSRDCSKRGSARWHGVVVPVILGTLPRLPHTAEALYSALREAAVLTLAGQHLAWQQERRESPCHARMP